MIAFFEFLASMPSWSHIVMVAFIGIVLAVLKGYFGSNELTREEEAQIKSERFVSLIARDKKNR